MSNSRDSDEQRRAIRTGIVYWGIPLALTLTLFETAQKHGSLWDGVLTLDFVLNLVIKVVVVGILGGYLWGRLMSTNPKRRK